ncbi:MAG: hypothetical protein HQK84_04380, partial [Nitrospinae bacterium]|nr:hypothetical protein [Nitrospinota bacterium]
MKILIVAATEIEIKSLLPFFAFIKQYPGNLSGYFFKDHTVYLFTAGVGMVTTTYNLTKILQQFKFDFVLNIGIAGSFSEKNEISLGDVVHVAEDVIAELGVDEGGRFVSLTDTGLIHNRDVCFKSEFAGRSCLTDFPSVKSVTVNTLSDNAIRNRELMERTDASVETMEGAAVCYVCSRQRLPWVQLRAVSN